MYTSDQPTLNDTYAVQSYAWTQQVVQLGGMSYCDAIAVHAYPYGQYYPFIAGSFFQYYVQQYSQLCNKPIWVTEVGQESKSTNWTATETQQSTFLAASYSMFQTLGVKAYIWYELSDNYTAIPDSNFGLFDNNGNPKPAFATFVNIVNGATSSTPTPTATPPPQATQNPLAISTPSPSPSPSQSPAATATFPPFSTPPPKPSSLENLEFALIVGLIVAFVILISTYLAMHRLKQSHGQTAENHGMEKG